MIDDLLEGERATLLAMPREEVQDPDIPMANVLQESSDLLTALQDGAIWQQLGAVGVPDDMRQTLARKIDVARAAQSSWTVSRDRTKTAAHGAREARAFALRSELVAAARYNLRDDRAALSTLSAILEGDSVPHLVQDLSDLATFIERNAAAFANDRTFDLPARVEEARSLASEVSASISLERLDSSQAESVDLRNRAYTQLAAVVRRLREAGRYAFQNEEDVRRLFISRYVAKKNARAARSRAASEADSGP